MYNIPGLSQTLQLSSYTACAILTGGITNWNDSHIAADNPGVSLPNLKITPVTESDSAGTNYVLEEWCIDEQPALWAAFAYQQQNTSRAGPTDGVAISATAPNSNWPGVAGGLDRQSTTGRGRRRRRQRRGHRGGAAPVRHRPRVRPGATPRRGWPRSRTPAASTPSPTRSTWPRPWPTPPSSPTAPIVLNFNGLGPHVYNPSTYSYLLTPTTGWSIVEGGDDERARQLRPHPGPAEGAQLRLRQPRAVTRAVRHQRRDPRRARGGGGHRGREGGLRVR